MNEVTRPPYRRSVNGAVRSIAPTALTAVTRTTYEPAGAGAPLDAFPSHESVCVPASSDAGGFVCTTVPRLVSTCSVTSAGLDRVNIALRPPGDDLGTSSLDSVRS